MQIDARAWLGLGASLFFFMGFGLAVEPESYAQAAAEWALEGGRSAEEARRLTVRLCRSLGLLFIACALAAAAVAAGLAPGMAARASRWAWAPRSRLICGAAATLASLLLSAVKMSEWAAPRGATTRGRAHFWSGWGVVFTLMAFGALALSSAAR